MAKVLLIDDNVDMQKMLSVVLKKQGHEVVNADRGQHGIELATSQPFNVVVLDVMMPDMNGYDVCRILRADPRTRDTPIIILTARAQPVDHQAALDAGADAYLAKPVDITDLHNKIQEFSNTGRPRPMQPTVPGATAPAAGTKPATGPLTGAAFFSAPAPAQPPSGRLISILCWRGGVGATTLAINLAGALIREGRRACLIDLSPSSGHAALMLRLRAKPNWTDLPAGLGPQNLAFSLLKHESGLQLLASPTQPQTEGLTAEIFNTVVQIMFTYFTDIVVDCAPVLDAATHTALLAANRILLPLAPEVAAIQTMTGTLATMAALQAPPDSLRLVLNHPTPNTALLPARIENALKRPLDAILPFDPAQSASLLQGVPLFMTQPKSPYMAALGTLIEKL